VALEHPRGSLPSRLACERSHAVLRVPFKQPTVCLSGRDMSDQTLYPGRRLRPRRRPLRRRARDDRKARRVGPLAPTGSAFLVDLPPSLGTDDLHLFRETSPRGVLCTRRCAEYRRGGSVACRIASQVPSRRRRRAPEFLGESLFFRRKSCGSGPVDRLPVCLGGKANGASSLSFLSVLAGRSFASVRGEQLLWTILYRLSAAYEVLLRLPKRYPRRLSRRQKCVVVTEPRRPRGRSSWWRRARRGGSRRSRKSLWAGRGSRRGRRRSRSRRRRRP